MSLVFISLEEDQSSYTLLFLLAIEIVRLSTLVTNQGYGDHDRLEHGSPMTSAGPLSNGGAMDLGGWAGLQTEVWKRNKSFSWKIVNLNFPFLFLFWFESVLNIPKKWINHKAIGSQEFTSNLFLKFSFLIYSSQKILNLTLFFLHL